ncbi:MAG: hypothetical protein ACRC6O_03245 [Flavobacterium sp.]
MIDIDSLFVNTGYIILLINTIVYTRGFFDKEKAYSIFVIYLFLLIIVQVLAFVSMMNHQSNLYLSHFYFMGQFVLLNLFYQSQFTNAIQKKTTNAILVLGVVLLGIQYILEPALFFKFNIFEVFVTSILTIVLAIMALYNMLSEKKRFYYITIGLILYLFSSAIIFFVGNLTVELSKDYRIMPWTINAFLVIIYQLFILYEWKVSYYPKKVRIK